MLDRWVINKSINHYPALALLGVRQVGKTTLERVLAEDIKSVYLDLEFPKDLVRLKDPTTFLESHRDKLIILDEIQHMPDIFLVLRGLIDQNKCEGRNART
ncbi:MAG: AAA family ATPase [Rhodobacteraceae bacterium]|nr:AAA family ATPase [Paracoccaceae bacterium]